MSLLRALPLRRLATASLPRNSRVLSRHAPRFLSTTAPARAEADDKTAEMMSAIRDSKFFKDLQGKPEVAKVMMETVQVLKEENFDLQKPSLMAMLTNSRIRDQMKVLYTTMQEAGVDMESAKETVEILKARMASEEK